MWDCKECGTRAVAGSLAACPHCGKPQDERERTGKEPPAPAPPRQRKFRVPNMDEDGTYVTEPDTPSEQDGGE